MRPRSCGIFADNIEDYIQQLKTEPQVKQIDNTLIQLFNFDCLSLDTSATSSQDDDEYSDVLSSDSIYTIRIKQATQTLLSPKKRKPLISIKAKRLAKQKKGSSRKI